MLLLLSLSRALLSDVESPLSYSFLRSDAPHSSFPVEICAVGTAVRSGRARDRRSIPSSSIENIRFFLLLFLLLLLFSASANFFFSTYDLSLLLLSPLSHLSSTTKQDALEPKISKHNMELHWGKHHRAYVTNLNGQIKGTDLENKTIEEIVKATWAGGKPTPAFNNAAQVWNHTFYWENMSPKKTAPNAALSAAIDRDFGSMDSFVKEFSAAGATQFGSGWAWLVVDKAGKLSIRKTANAETPLTDESVTAILTMDGEGNFYF